LTIQLEQVGFFVLKRSAKPSLDSANAINCAKINFTMCRDVKYLFTNCGHEGDAWVEPCSYAKNKGSRLCSKWEVRSEKEVKRRQCCSRECCEEMFAKMEHDLETTHDWTKGVSFYTPERRVLMFYTPQHFASFMRRAHEACEFDEYGKAV